MAKKISLILALALFSIGASAMFWPFKKYDVEMSPEVRGVITLDGMPQAGLTVYREVFYEGYKKGKIIKDVVQTNQFGEFYFSSRFVKSSAPQDIFGQNLKVRQFIFVEFINNKYKLWGASVPPRSNKKLLLMLNDMKCELTSVQCIHQVDLSPDGPPISVHSICDWKADYISTYRYDENTDNYIKEKD